MPLGFAFALAGAVAEGWLPLARSLAALPLVPAILALATWKIDEERRYVREWADLELD